jgi:hypothetical protein
VPHISCLSPSLAAHLNPLLQCAEVPLERSQITHPKRCLRSATPPHSIEVTAYDGDSIA